MLHRDPSGIIMQDQPGHEVYLDGGDSANRCAIMALCGSQQDKRLLYKFYIGGGYCVRHPNQYPNNTANTFSRDQAIPYMAGLKSANLYITANAVLERTLLDACFLPNTHFHPTLEEKQFPHGPDFCHPGVIWHFILCAEAWWLYWLAPLGYFCQLLDLLWACFVKPWDEQNQVFCMFSVSGLLPLYLKLHPDFKKAMKDYWCGWRNQESIYQAIVKKAGLV